MPRIIPNLWFDTQAEEAAEFYVSVFPNSRVVEVSRYTEAGPGPAGSGMVVDCELDGQPFTAINGGPQFPFTEAVSLLVERADQAEIEHYWDALTAGGEEVRRKTQQRRRHVGPALLHACEHRLEHCRVDG